MKHRESEESYLLDRVVCWFMDLKKRSYVVTKSLLLQPHPPLESTLC